VRRIDGTGETCFIAMTVFIRRFMEVPLALNPFSSAPAVIRLMVGHADLPFVHIY